MDRITRAIEALKKGPSALAELETILGDMDMQQRKVLVRRVEESDIPAPMIVFYDYDKQVWIKDYKTPVTPQARW